MSRDLLVRVPAHALGLGVALEGTAHEAEAAFTQKIVFGSDRTTGADNPTGDYEVFKKADHIGVKPTPRGACGVVRRTVSARVRDLFGAMRGGGGLRTVLTTCCLWWSVFGRV